ncbi:MAG: hypothetical protein ACEPOW_13870 [Bacteroidales bacterium]
MNFHEALTKAEFIERFKENYSIDNARNKEFMEALESYEFVSIERYVDNFKIIQEYEA